MKTFLFLLLVVGIVAGALYFKHSGDSGLKSLTPNELAELIDKSENYRAAFFHEKKFQNRISKDELSNDSGYLVTANIYEKGVKQRYSTTLSKVEEKVTTTSDLPSWIGYLLSNKKDYENFFAYLRNDRGINLSPVQMKEFSVRYSAYSGIKYLNCIFVDYGFEEQNNMYLIAILKYEKLSH